MPHSVLLLLLLLLLYYHANNSAEWSFNAVNSY